MFMGALFYSSSSKFAADHWVFTRERQCSSLLLLLRNENIAQVLCVKYLMLNKHPHMTPSAGGMLDGVCRL